jgi:hypothetical protein
VLASLSEAPRTALEIAPAIHNEPISESNASWLLSETLCYLTHLERRGEIERGPDGEGAQWRLAGSPAPAA